MISIKSMKWNHWNQLQTFDFSYFLGKNYFVDDAFQNVFIYQPSFNMLDINQVNGECNVSVWKSKWTYTFNLVPFHDLAPFIKNFDNKIRLQFNNSILS